MTSLGVFLRKKRRDDGEVFFWLQSGRMFSFFRIEGENFFWKTVAHFFIFIFCMLIVFKISCDGGNGGKF